MPLLYRVRFKRHDGAAGATRPLTREAAWRLAAIIGRQPDVRCAWPERVADPLKPPLPHDQSTAVRLQALRHGLPVRARVEMPTGPLGAFYIVRLVAGKPRANGLIRISETLLHSRN